MPVEDRVLHRRRVRMGKEKKKAWVRTAAAKATARTTTEKKIAVASKVTVVGVASGLLPKSLSPEGRVCERDPAHEGSGTKWVPDEQHGGGQAPGP